MGKIVVKIVTPTAAEGVAGGLVKGAQMKPFKADLARLTTDIAATQVSGGVLPMTAAEYAIATA